MRLCQSVLVLVATLCNSLASALLLYAHVWCAFDLFFHDHN